jgi:hypothetical protein
MSSCFHFAVFEALFCFSLCNFFPVMLLWAFAQHILSKGHQYGPMEQIMEMIEYARKGSIMNIKENCYIYQFKQLNELIEEQESIKENDSQNSIFNIAIRH